MDPEPTDAELGRLWDMVIDDVMEESGSGMFTAADTDDGRD